MGFDAVPWHMVPDVAADGTVTVRVTAHEVPATEDEEVRGIGAYLREVQIGGHAVYGTRVLAHRYAGRTHAEAHARSYVMAEFALRLRETLGYDPEAARG